MEREWFNAVEDGGRSMEDVRREGWAVNGKAEDRDRHCREASCNDRARQCNGETEARSGKLSKKN